MTKEEAIKILTNHTQYKCNGENLAALNRAIEALEQEPCGDAISRQAAIDELCKMLHDCFGADDEELDAVITTLNQLQPIAPAKKVGQWINPTTMQCMKEQVFYYCSVCGNYADANKYCPNCGAKMERWRGKNDSN